MPMIYTLTSEVQCKLQEFLESMKEEEIKRIRDEEERILKAEEAKYKGTPVTKESFFIWKEQFTKEMNKDMSTVKESTQKGLTGLSVWIWYRIESVWCWIESMWCWIESM